MSRDYAKFILAPVVLLLVLAGALVYAGAKLEGITGSVSEAKVHSFTQELLKEPMSEKVRAFVVQSEALDRADRRTDKSLNEMLRAFALGVVFCATWLAIGGYKLRKEAQQGVPADRPRPAGEAGG